MSIILIFFWLAAAVLAATILLVLLPQHCKNGRSKVRAAFAGFFAAGILLHFPMYFAEYAGGHIRSAVFSRGGGDLHRWSAADLRRRFVVF